MKQEIQPAQEHSVNIQITAHSEDSVAMVFGKNVFQTGTYRYARNIQKAVREAGWNVVDADLVRREWRVFGRPVGGFVSLWSSRFTTSFAQHGLVHALDPCVATKEVDVLTVHDLIQEELPHWYQKAWGSKIDVRLNRHFGKKAKVVLASSEVTRELLIKFWGLEPERVVTNHLGSDDTNLRAIREPTALVPDDKPTFVYVGDDNIRKNVGLTVRALKVLKDEGLDARFIHVGPNRHPEIHTPYREYARAHDLDFVEAGYLEDDELGRVLGNATAFVWPTLAEGFGLPPVEAMRAGLPVVALDTRVNREVCGDVTAYHDNTPGGAATAMRSVLETRPHASQLLRHADSFRWANTARKTIEAYETVARA